MLLVVVAGLLSNTQHNRYVLACSECWIVLERTWDLIVYTLNGIIFFILGIELSVLCWDTIADVEVYTWQALEFVVIVYLGILVCWTLWIYGYMWLTVCLKGNPPLWRAALLSGILGVRGLFTLVGVLLVSAALANGQPSPERSLSLFMLLGVVVLSLIVAIVACSLVTRCVAPR